MAMNKKYIWLFTGLVLLMGFWLFGQSQDATDKTQTVAIQNWDVHQVKEYLEKNPDTILIDVRTAPEFTGELGHIPGARLKPLQEIEKWYGELEKEKDKKIILVCRSGNRSGVAAGFLVKKGFTDVVNMAGGMRAWNAAKYEVAK